MRGRGRNRGTGDVERGMEGGDEMMRDEGREEMRWRERMRDGGKGRENMRHEGKAEKIIIGRKGDGER